MIIYKATEQDIDVLIQLRIDFIKIDKGHLSEDDENVIRIRLQKYFEKHLSLGDFIAVIAKIDSQVVASAFLSILERPANTSFITGLTATLMNVLTYPPFRNKGIATRVIKTLIEEAEQAGVSSIDLFATEDGKPLYEKLGFTEPSYTAMRLKL